MSEHASQVIDLNTQLKATSERVKAKDEELAEARKSIKTLEDRLAKEKSGKACLMPFNADLDLTRTRCRTRGRSRAGGGAARASARAPQD